MSQSSESQGASYGGRPYTQGSFQSTTTRTYGQSGTQSGVSQSGISQSGVSQSGTSQSGTGQSGSSTSYKYYTSSNQNRQA